MYKKRAGEQIKIETMKKGKSHTREKVRKVYGHDKREKNSYKQNKNHSNYDRKSREKIGKESFKRMMELEKEGNVENDRHYEQFSKHARQSMGKLQRK